MPVLRRDDAEIVYEEYGAGFPVLLFAPGGMRSRTDMWHAGPDGTPRAWHDWTQVLAADYRVIAMDQRNAGRSRGAVADGQGWDSYADDHIALLDHLGIGRCHTLGGCIGASFCLKLAQRAPGRTAAMVLQNPIGLNPDAPAYFPEMFAEWTREQRASRPELAAGALAALGAALWGSDFVFAVDRAFVRGCAVPALVLPGNDTPHPRATGLELAELLPDAECLVDWKGPAHLDAQRAAVTGFLARHTPR